ncbi:lipoprotein signal peptidase [Caldicellulosiruptor kronotskyensis 2002]|uniref:Lipoprotein signal peptidase n=1 Tax=Caldicellulosiruptor kronotskyensis (strain DSM 18902 / VKM B-2412 / 2002) TaxID=632348 RepID=E4SBS0_CALK2|nr:signal peptidase II [Caldicellulosiruptor kronotskyensis]ADQ46193.1 lipoprotein signal peptidase [Caldicellulosiruptor kronotskyensis 2002]
MVYWIIIMLTFVLDQITKARAENVFVGSSINLLGGILSLTYVQNRGGAFSILEGKRRFFIVVSIVLILFLCYMIFKSTNNLYKLSFSLIVGGAMGNLFDRIAKGYVVDFIDIKVIPVFNLADFFITCGVLLLIFLILKEGGEEIFLKKKP